MFAFLFNCFHSVPGKRFLRPETFLRYFTPLRWTLSGNRYVRSGN